jgi:hypothetical protein
LELAESSQVNLHGGFDHFEGIRPRVNFLDLRVLFFTGQALVREKVMP